MSVRFLPCSTAYISDSFFKHHNRTTASSRHNRAVYTDRANFFMKSRGQSPATIFNPVAFRTTPPCSKGASYGWPDLPMTTAHVRAWSLLRERSKMPVYVSAFRTPRDGDSKSRTTYSMYKTGRLTYIRFQDNIITTLLARPPTRDTELREAWTARRPLLSTKPDSVESEVGLVRTLADNRRSGWAHRARVRG